MNSKEKSSWVKIQHKAFARWINIQFENSGSKEVQRLRVRNLAKDLSDGVKLNYLVREISKGKYKKHFNARPKFRIHYVDNISCALEYLKSSGIRLHSIGAEDIYEGNLKMILGLIWGLILNTLIELENAQDFSTIKKILLAWCAEQVQEFDGLVTITDFSTSWNNGVALCALLSSLRPDLLDFYTLDLTKKEVNTRKAIALAAKIGIPQLIDCEDLLCTRPDEKSVVTYILGWYEKFNDKQIMFEDSGISRSASIKSSPKMVIQSLATCTPKKPQESLRETENYNHIQNTPKKDHHSPKKVENDCHIQSTPKKHQKSVNKAENNNQLRSTPVKKASNTAIENPFHKKSLSQSKTSDSNSRVSPVSQNSPAPSSAASPFSMEESPIIENTRRVSPLLRDNSIFYHSRTKEIARSFDSRSDFDLSRSSSVSRAPSISKLNIMNPFQRNEFLSNSAVDHKEKWFNSLDSQIDLFESSHHNASKVSIDFSLSSQEDKSTNSSYQGLTKKVSLFSVNSGSDDSISVPERSRMRIAKNVADPSDQESETFRAAMMVLSEVFALKEEYEKRSKIFASNVRTQIYKWTNLVSYNELYDLDELEYERKYLEETFQKTKRSFKLEKNNISLIFNKINFLLKSLNSEYSYKTKIGLGLDDLDKIWRDLCAEEARYLQQIILKLSTLKSYIKNNYLDTLKVINGRYLSTKDEIGKFLTNYSMSNEEKIPTIQGFNVKVDQLVSLLKNMSLLNQQCIKYQIDYDDALNALKSMKFSEASNKPINPFDTVELFADEQKTPWPAEFLDYNELLFEVNMLQETTKNFSCFLDNKTVVKKFDANELSQMFDKFSVHNEFITKKEFRSVICTSEKFDKEYSKSLESSLPVHVSRSGYDFRSFIENISAFDEKNVLGAPIALKLSKQNTAHNSDILSPTTSSVYNDEGSPRLSSLGSIMEPPHSPESDPSASDRSVMSTPSSVNDSSFSPGSPDTVYEDESDGAAELNIKFKNRRRIANKFSKYPTKLQLPMDFTIVLEEQFST
ncbi:hypothetical protein DASC09_043900 [Saccharomycopsis crataegensis]|uniref:Calponin-homology (CH) domain-containing protein n=1 Tax=Saccharomycopsis crataegensis TaxID=43959 RepID=A0AAV5QR95_9ASCO|nr:hypothetical protein DASC09_043900 [Saccharomycopsis crataegensis]